MNEEINKTSIILSWVILIMILVSGYLVSVFEGLNLFFLMLLIVEIVGVILYFRNFTRMQFHISRIVIGCLFIFSGFVKGVDPVGTDYRIVDYFVAFGTDWAIPLAMPLSVILNAAEFILGVMLLLNIRMKLTSWTVLIMMVFFTFITLNDAFNNPVPDCGCFGSALLVSNWQTIYKNLVIDALLLIVFFSRKRIPPWFGMKSELAIFVIFLTGFIYFQIYNIRHLPVIDFRDWKIGNSVVHDAPLPVKYYVTYRNKSTGEIKEYLSPDYPYNDSSWMKQWEFVSQRIEDPNPKRSGLIIEDSEKTDVTQQILENHDWQFILISYDLSKANLKNIQRIRNFITKCDSSGIAFALITASLPETAQKFLADQQLETEAYFADDIMLMSMIRSNPGLILLKNGVVRDKWHYNDFPDFTEFREKYLKESGVQLPGTSKP